MKTWRVLSLMAFVMVMVGALVACVTNPATEPAPVQSQASVPVYFALGGGRLVVANGGTLEVQSGGTISAATGSTISLNGVALSGPIRYGTASTVISGTKISHGLGTTPTLFLPQNATAQAATFTQSLYAPLALCNTVSCTVYATAGSVVTFTTVQWQAGK